MMTAKDKDRLDLNQRFKNVYEILEQKGLIVKNHRKLSKSAFARKLGTKGHIIDKYLNGERKVTYAQVKKLCQSFDISEAFMFQGIGQAFPDMKPPIAGNPFALLKRKSKDVSNSDRPLTVTNFNILFTSIEAFASDTVNIDVSENNQLFHIPGLQGQLVAFNIKGNSMSPTIVDGDMVICNALDTIDQIQENEIYAVVANGTIRVKRLQRVYDNYGNWSHLKLLSDNFIDHDPDLLPTDDVKQLFKVMKRLTGLDGVE